MAHLTSPDERFLHELSRLMEDTDTYQLKDAIRKLLLESDGIGSILDNVKASEILDYVKSEQLLQQPQDIEYEPDEFFTETELIDAAAETLDSENIGIILERMLAQHTVRYYEHHAPRGDRTDFWQAIDTARMINEIDDTDQLTAMRDQLNEILGDTTGDNS